MKNYVRSLGPDLSSAVDRSMEKLCAHAGVQLSGSTEYPSEFERLAIHYALETAPAHVFTLRNYVVLYGFLRSMTMILILMTWLLAAHVFHFLLISRICLCSAVCGFLSVLIIGGFFSSICYGSFLKFWTRYNREALMAVTAAFVKARIAAPKAQEDPF